MDLVKKLYEISYTNEVIKGPWGEIEYNSDGRTKLYKSGLMYTIDFSNSADYDHAFSVLKDKFGQPARWKNVEIRSKNYETYMKSRWQDWTIYTKWATSWSAVYVDNPETVKTVLLHYILAEDITDVEMS